MEKVAIFLVLVPLLAFAQTQNQCIPKCTPADIPPLEIGGRPCLCTFEAPLSGCTVNACEPGADASAAYTCQCTPENHQEFCVTLRCTNGTEAHTSGATATSGPVDQPAKPSCNNLCKCGSQPPDCDENSKNPYEGAPACSCNSILWPTGCTLKPCEKGGTQYCECTTEYSPEKCLKPQCKSLLL